MTGGEWGKGGGSVLHQAAAFVSLACRCVAEAAGAPPPPDRWQSGGPQQATPAFPPSQEVKLQSSLSLSLPSQHHHSHCTFHLHSVRARVCVRPSVSVFARLLIYSLHSPSACVNISVRDKGTEGGCWLLFASVLPADTGGNKWRAGSCPARSLRWLPSLMAISRR